MRVESRGGEEGGGAEEIKSNCSSPLVEVAQRDADSEDDDDGHHQDADDVA